jgi:micrococcal nuclease
MKRRFVFIIILVVGFIASRLVNAPTTPETPSETQANELYPVIHITDGDTIIISKDGVDERIRLLGIDTPETNSTRGDVECYGKEASEKTTSLLNGQSVSIETDPTQAQRDRYGRTLAYVSLPDGTLINKILVEGGYAKEYTYDAPYVYQSDFRSAEKIAKDKKRGLWSLENCPS